MEIRILGALEVREGNQPIPVGGARQRALLVLLATRANQVLAADHLVEGLWGETPPEGAANALQAAVSRLRRALQAGGRSAARRPRIRTRPSGYVLEVDPEAIDSARFERLAAEGRRALAEGDPGKASSLLAEALGLWRGPALAEFTYEPFAQAEISRLEELRLEATEDRVEAELASGRHAEVVAELESLVGSHPFRERVRGQLMLALYRSGRQAEALEAYRRGREVLAEELGIDPTPELTELEARILRQDPALLLPPARPPPAPAVAPPTPEPPPPAPLEIRKTVTVVFCDLAESTALGERLDPEALRGVMARYFEVAREAFHRHGGTVEKFIGDAVMAVFGLPVLHEDDALRAVRAASDLAGDLEALDAELTEGWGTRLQVRVGVNTGEVVAGQAEGGQVLVTGDPVNTAARLQQAADPGGILIGETTHRLVAGAVEAEPVPALTLKGKRQGVAAWRVSRLIPGAAPYPRRLDAPLVGRKAELAQLHQAFHRAVEERTAYLFTVLGAPGVGKTRLALEFSSAVGQRATVLAGRCLPYGEGITYWPLREILHQAFGEDARGGIADLLEGAEHAALIADQVAGAVGAAVIQGSGEEIRWAVRRVLEALALRRPVALVLEDLHWAEPAFLDLVDHLADLITEAPVVLVCLARPELLEDRPAWGGGKRNATTLELEPLGPDDARALLANLAPSAEALPRPEQIMAVAEGNPLFLEQMVAALADPPADGEIRLPETIQALLAARLEHLGPGERGVLERAAVVGKEFSRPEVAELFPEEARPTLTRHLDQLVRKRYIRPARSGTPPGSSYQFRHVLVQEATYRGIPKRTRAELHERFADWVLRSAGDQLPEYEEIAGYHLEQAYRYRREVSPSDEHLRELRQRAAGILASAGLRASAREDYHGAESLLSRCVDLWPLEDLTGRAGALLGLDDLLHTIGEYSRSDAVLAEATDCARVAGDRALLARADLRRIRLRASLDRTLSAEEGLRGAEEAAEVLAEVGDEAGLAEAWARIAFFRHGLGHQLGGEVARDRARAFASVARDPWLDPRLAGGYVALPWTGTGPRPAAEEAARAREMLGGAAERRTDEAYALLTLGLHVAMRGEFEAARQRVAGASAIFEDLGLKVEAVAYAGLVRAQVEVLAGDPTAAEQALRPGIEVFESIGNTGQLSTWVAFMARILYEQGRHDDALEAAEWAERLTAAGDMETHLRFPGVRAEILAHRGEPEEAERLAREVVQMAEGTDWLNYRGDAFTDLAEVLRLIGRPRAAADALRAAEERYEQKGNVVSAARARAQREKPEASTRG